MNEERGGIHETLVERHETLQAACLEGEPECDPQEVATFLEELRAAHGVASPEEQAQLKALILHWEEVLAKGVGASRPDLREGVRSLAQRGRALKAPPLWAAVLGGVVLLIGGAALVATTLVASIEELPKPEVLPPTEVADLPAGLPGDQQEVPETDGGAPVDSLPQPPDPPTPTEAPAMALPTPTAAPTLTATQVTVATPITPTRDVEGDVAPLAGGPNEASPPEGVDVAACNIATSTLVLADLAPPEGITVTEDALVVWMALQEPVPDDRALDYHWLIALDLDGQTETGRPAGDGYINPDLGNEVGAGLFLYIDDELDPYLFVWDAGSEDWAEAADVPEGLLTVTLAPGRDVVLFTLEVDGLAEAVDRLTGVDLVPGEIRGRVGAIASSMTRAAVVDYCPDLPE
jgi:hypothetical protein